MLPICNSSSGLHPTPPPCISCDGLLCSDLLSKCALAILIFLLLVEIVLISYAWAVGDVWSCTEVSDAPAQIPVIVVGTFADGKEQVVFQGTV
jgi:hypothetical protein